MESPALLHDAQVTEEVCDELRARVAMMTELPAALTVAPAKPSVLSLQ